jgi:UDP-glucose 4-epimerase
MQNISSIAIIGANSYIGRNLAYVISKDHPHLNLFLYDIDDAHSDSLAPYCQIDLLNKESLHDINFDCDAIYFFSARTGTIEGFQHYEEFIDINEKGLLNFLDTYVKKKSTAKIVFPSTRLVYKGSNKPIKEDSQLDFKTIYSLNKYCCEKYLELYAYVFDVKYVIFRICVPYGSSIVNTKSYGTVSTMIEKAKKGENLVIFGNGLQKRTFTNIKDLCLALIVGSLNPRLVNDVYNIGGADQISILDAAQLIAEQYDVQVCFKPWPIQSGKIESGDTVFDSSKLDNEIKIQYENDFETWIRNV